MITTCPSSTRLIPLTFDLCHIVDIALRLTNADGTDNHQSPDYCIAYHQLLFRPDALTRSCLPQTCCISCRSFTHLLTHSRHPSTSIGEFVPTCAHPRALCTRDPTDFTAVICPVQQPYESANTSTFRQPVFLPSCQPSERPSSQPSGQPTDGPTKLSTFQPLRQPTSTPSRRPSHTPTSQPQTNLSTKRKTN